MKVKTAMTEHVCRNGRRSGLPNRLYLVSCPGGARRFGQLSGRRSARPPRAFLPPLFLSFCSLFRPLFFLFSELNKSQLAFNSTDRVITFVNYIRNLHSSFFYLTSSLKNYIMCRSATCNNCRKHHSLTDPSLITYLDSHNRDIAPWLASFSERDFDRTLCLHMSALDKATWWGCGNHIPGVLDSVDEKEWCTCEPKVEKNGKQYPPMAASAN